MIIPCKDLQSVCGVSFKKQLWSLMREQRKDEQLCDVIIKCDNQRFPTHGIMLASTSPYFKAHLLGSFKKCHSEGKSHIDLSGFNSSSVALLLDLVYEEDEIDGNIEIFDFIQLLDYIQLDAYNGVVLKTITSHITLENCLELFQLSLSYHNASYVNKQIVLFIAHNFLSLINCSNWKYLPSTTVKALLKFNVIKSLPSYLLDKATSLYSSVDIKECQSSLKIYQDKDMQDIPKTLIAFRGARKPIVELHGTPMEPGFKEALQSHDFDKIFTCDGEISFVYGGQAFVLFFPAYEDFPFQLMRYDSCNKTLNKVWEEKIKDLEYPTNIFADNNDRYVYLIGLKKSISTRNVIENPRRNHAGVSQISRDIVIIKMNMETYKIERKYCITSFPLRNISDFRVCCNLEQGEIYFLSTKKLSTYYIKTQNIVSSTLSFDRAAALKTKQRFNGLMTLCICSC